MPQGGILIRAGGRLNTGILERGMLRDKGKSWMCESREFGIWGRKGGFLLFQVLLALILALCPEFLWDQDTPASQGSRAGRGKVPHSQIPGFLSQLEEPSRVGCLCPWIPRESIQGFGNSHPKIHLHTQSWPIPLILGFVERAEFLGALGILCSCGAGEGTESIGIQDKVLEFLEFLGRTSGDKHGGKILLLFPGSSPGAWKAGLKFPEIFWDSLGTPRLNFEFRAALHLPSSQISWTQNPLG